MNTGGWIVMTLSVGSVCALMLFCFYRVFTSSDDAPHIQDPHDIDTHDAGT